MYHLYCTGVTLDFDNALPTGYVVEEDDMTLMVCVVAAAENGIQQNFEASVNFITGGATRKETAEMIHA